MHLLMYWCKHLDAPMHDHANRRDSFLALRLLHHTSAGLRFCTCARVCVNMLAHALWVECIGRAPSGRVHRPREPGDEAQLRQQLHVHLWPGWGPAGLRQGAPNLKGQSMTGTPERIGTCL
eukprot:1138913-Pelagomonas_calceolata.AAC.2